MLQSEIRLFRSWRSFESLRKIKYMHEVCNLKNLCVQNSFPYLGSYDRVVLNVPHL